MGSKFDYERKLEIRFWFGISKMAFRLFGVHTRRRDKVEVNFCLLNVSCKLRTCFLCYDFECKSH